MSGKKSKHGQPNHFETCGYCQGLDAVENHPVFRRLANKASIARVDKLPGASTGWACVGADGRIYASKRKSGSKDEWAYVLSHCLLHLALDHFRQEYDLELWQIACDIWVAKFLAVLKFGRAPDDMIAPCDVKGGSEMRIYDLLESQGAPDYLLKAGTAGYGKRDMVPARKTVSGSGREIDWQKLFALGLQESVKSAVNVAGGLGSHVGAGDYARSRTAAQKAKQWFVDCYPLLGAIAAAFELVESAQICGRMQISVAAVNSQAREIYINPAAGLDEMECRFVMAHEFLHAALCHDERCQGRDHYLWNIACDFVINSWLIEMGVGEMPQGLLYDPSLKELSAESVYDRIVKDMRRFRKLATLRGKGDHGDILPGSHGHWRQCDDGVSLDEFYRRSLAQGLNHHLANGRGELPAALVEEIRAMAQPPIAWDVELAQWFDSFFPPAEKSRTYARPSRRQSATPFIPRPRYMPDNRPNARTFAVVLDTSGSMDRLLLAKALGAIASYSISRAVEAARVVFCDAHPYDQGYMPPYAIASRVRVKGRGGTVLQPAIELLQEASDFPAGGPILIITDGYCDKLRIRREHAYLMPAGSTLPFVPAGKIFRIK